MKRFTLTMIILALVGIHGGCSNNMPTEAISAGMESDGYQAGYQQASQYLISDHPIFEFNEHFRIPTLWRETQEIVDYDCYKTNWQKIAGNSCMETLIDYDYSRFLPCHHGLVDALKDYTTKNYNPT